jgi:putative transposase
MPYESRGLTPEQRAELAHYRRQNGYPEHAPPHPFRDERVYLISAANYQHKRIMESGERRTAFETELLSLLHSIATELVAWVVLPNHYHVLLDVPSLNDVSRALRQLHGSTSRQWNLEDNMTGKRTVWYRFEDRVIRGDQHLRLTFNYIHYNPVKHGYVKDSADWPWSSRTLYYEEKGEAWLQAQTESAAPPRDWGKGWDDDF